jgi:hypothetical protein
MRGAECDNRPQAIAFVFIPEFIMPPRYLVTLIIAFWLAVAGWTVWRNAPPHLQANEPPPFAIDVTDESTHTIVFWTVSQNSQEIGIAETEVREDQGGLFRLEARYKIKMLQGLASAEVTNRYRVTPDGALRGVTAEVVMGGTGQPETLKGVIDGPVADEVFEPAGTITFNGVVQKVSFDPVAMTGQASILNPLHPVNRIKGLRAGRSWQVPLFNPVSLILTAKLEGKADPLIQLGLGLLRNQADGKQITLSAQVQHEPQRLNWNREAAECYVIDYKGDDHTARTWVRVKDGLVLRQEAKYRDDTLVLVRRGDKDSMEAPIPRMGPVPLPPGGRPGGMPPVALPPGAPRPPRPDGFPPDPRPMTPPGP